MSRQAVFREWPTLTHLDSTRMMSYYAQGIIFLYINVRIRLINLVGRQFCPTVLHWRKMSAHESRDMARDAFPGTIIGSREKSTPEKNRKMAAV